MAESWINTKGKKFVGQTASVPAPDEKQAVVVDYADWNKLSIFATQVGADPSEAANAGVQTVGVSVVMTMDGATPYANWSYDFMFSRADDSQVPVTLQNAVAIPGGFSLDVLFPVGVVAGQVGTLKIISDDRKATLNITVAA